MAVLIVAVACVMMAWGVEEQSTSSIKNVTKKYGEDEDREDELYVSNMERLGTE